MKKIAILSAVNIRHMSLISLYTDILKRENIAYDIIYMDKYGEDEDFECAHKFRYVNIIKPQWPGVIKAVKYMRFLPYAAHILNRNKYDFVIVWNDVAIFMFANYLSHFYKGKYCLNVRDNMGYQLKSRKRRYAKVFENAAVVTISSKGYLDILPPNISYTPIHSLNMSVLNGMHIHTELRKITEPIRIGFIGSVRYFERNKRMLDVFANDKRFVLAYYGTNANVLKRYAEEKGILNVDFHDSFPVEDTAQYLEKIDIINNLYGNDTLNVQKAISIKFFHALYARIPILVCSNTYVGELAQEIGVGYEVKKINTDMKEKLYDWYHRIDFSELNVNCKNYLNKAEQENAEFEEKIMKYLI